MLENKKVDGTDSKREEELRDLEKDKRERKGLVAVIVGLCLVVLVCFVIAAMRPREEEEEITLQTGLNEWNMNWD